MTEVDQKKLDEFEGKLKKLLTEYGFAFSVNIHFPQYNILPDHLKLALKIIEKEQGQYTIGYVEQNYPTPDTKTS